MKVGKGRRKKKQLKGDMDAMRGYDKYMYGGGDFNETRAGIFAPFAKNLVTRLAGIEDKAFNHSLAHNATTWSFKTCICTLASSLASFLALSSSAFLRLSNPHLPSLTPIRLQNRVV
jgi:hypothetical protein